MKSAVEGGVSTVFVFKYDLPAGEQVLHISAGDLGAGSGNCAMLGSNQRLLACEASALPLS